MKNVFFSKNIMEGWYIVQGMEGIEYDGERIDIPFTIENKLQSEKNFKGKNSVNLTISHYKYQKHSEQALSDLLACLDVWERINFIFPEPTISIFESKVVDHLKAKVPGMFCMMHVVRDSEGFCRINAMAKVGSCIAELNEIVSMSEKFNSKLNIIGKGIKAK